MDIKAKIRENLNESKKNQPFNMMSGVIGKYSYEAKVTDTPSPKGINKGRVLNLKAWETNKRLSNGYIFSYDGDWELTNPKTEEHTQILNDILKKFQYKKEKYDPEVLRLFGKK